MRKRILSGLIVLTMIFSLLPQTISFANPSDLGLLWPVKGYYGVDSGFGNRSYTGSFHGGIDIFRPTNTVIYAAQSGVVERATYHNSWGNHVKIRHNGTYHTLYAHMTKYIVSAGDYVQRGQPIGYVGQTGNAYGPHLHFEIYENGTRINPVPVNVDGRHTYSGSAPLVQAVYYSYDDGTYGSRNEEPAHTHSWQVGYDDVHPHKQYNYCSGCGEKEYSGMQRKVTSCKQCYPLGSARLTRDFNKVSGTATFYRNNVSNANDYTLTLYKDGSRYGSYDMSSTSKTVRSLSPGYYTASLSVSNKNTGETKTASSSSFTIVNTYNVSYNANDGTGAPSSQTKIQDTNLTLSSTIPKKTGHIFKGWASSKTAKDAQYSAGGTYTKNAKITLYAVWEPETYVIKFDANGGKGELADTTITYGNTLRMPNSVVKDGFYLKGWSTNKSATNADYRANMDYKLTANTQLYAVWGSSTWGGTVATEFAGGDGTEENPYQISNAGELAHLAKIVNEQSAAPEYKYYVLTDNISLGYEEWVPIGVYDNENQYFKGSFDGNGFTISDLNISQPNSGYVGIFGYTKDSTIKNITVTGDITGITSNQPLHLGAIAGYSRDLTAENCTGTYINISDITKTDTVDDNHIGALFGMVIRNKIESCKANECYVSVKDGTYQMGVIAGRVSGDILNCEVKSSGELLGSTANTIQFSAGGIVGVHYGTIKECRVDAGFLTGTFKTNSGGRLGGLIGWQIYDKSWGEFKGVAELCSVNFTGGLTKNIDGNSYSTSMAVTSTGPWSVQVGGLVGNSDMNAKIKNCIYNGESISVTSTGEAQVGGAVGYKAGATTEKIAAQGGMPLNRDLLPKRDGYKATWYTDSDFKNEYDFTQNVSADTTLYAKWEEGEEEQPEIWDGTTKQPSYNASTKTYTVTNGAELAWIAALVNGELELDLPVDSTMEGYTVELANDIYLNDISDIDNWETAAPANEWKPIGSSESKPFSGTLNGNNHSIYGEYCVGDYSGLVGYAVNSTIENLSIKNGLIGGINNTCVGSAAGYAGNSNIKYCYNYISVSGRNRIGGVVGSGNNTLIKYCGNEGNIKFNSSGGGGIIETCFGGVVGYTNTSVSYCYNTGSVSGISYVGGLIGMSESGGSTISYCYNIGLVTGEWESIGGIAGSTACGTVSGCYNVGNVTGVKRVGGIVGYTSGSSTRYSILDCCYATQSTLYNKGDYVTITSVSKKTEAQMKSLSNLSGFSTSIWANDTNNTNNGYPYLTALKKHNITVVEDIDAIPINRVFANVNGIIYGQSAQNAQAGGIIGHVGTTGAETSPARNMLAIADRVSAVSSGSSYYAKAGDIVGEMTNNAFDFSDTYAYSSMDLSAVNSATAANASTNNISSSRTLAQIKRAAFLKQVFGEPYQSLEYLKTHPDAVWVQKDGELPELYFNVLNDITVSETENGTITVDRTQAVDDEIVNVTASPAEGYELNKVYVNGKEIDGTTFAVDGDSDVFATFIEKTPEFSVEIEADANATASLTNVDEADVQLSSVGEFTLFADEPVTELTASDGEEIKVTAAADEDYTVDAIYVNGEEIAGDSFILTDDTKVTLEVTSISTDTKAVTNDADNVGSYFAMLSGSVEGDTEGVSRYIRYWEKDNPDEVFTTEVEDGAGEYSAELMPLVADTTYQYQMTEYGEVKEFTTLHEDEVEYYDDGVDDDLPGSTAEPTTAPTTEPTAQPTSEPTSEPTKKPTTEPTSQPTTEPTSKPTDQPTTEPTAEPTAKPVKRDICFDIQNQSKGKFSVSANVVNTTDEAQSGLVIYAAYDGNGTLVKVEAETITDLAANGTFPVEFAIADGAEKYKILVWDSWKTMLPIAASVDIE